MTIRFGLGCDVVQKNQTLLLLLLLLKMMMRMLHRYTSSSRLILLLWSVVLLVPDFLPRIREKVVSLSSWSFLFASAYHRTPCTRQAAADFSFDDCYLPSMNPDLALAGQASFVLAHDAATGYIQKNHLSPDGLTWAYSKTQDGSLYQQLQDGARALDLRPKLWHNGTIVFHHGAITVPIDFELAVQDVIQWCNENPTEIVLLLTSHYSFGRVQQNIHKNDDEYGERGDNSYYDAPGMYNDDYNDEEDYYYSPSQQDDKNAAMVTALQKLYQQYGVTYLACSDIYDWTVATVKENAALANGGGFLLALDGQDTYPGSFCGKENWIESQVVTCWSTNATSCKKSDIPYQNLEDYILQSANNEATDNSKQLGPPSNLYRYPFNEIQALWQVSASSAAIGLAHLSNILADDQVSNLHVKLVDLIHRESMPGSISLLAVDNVRFHGNALTSVLRNRCGQSILSNGDVPCGPDLPPPQLHYFHLEARVIIPVVLGLYVVSLVILFFRKRPHLIQVIPHEIAQLWKHYLSRASSKRVPKDFNQNLIPQHPEKVIS